MQMNKNTKEYYSFLSERQQNVLYEYLTSRFLNVSSSDTFNIVFDLLHECNLNCIGCGTNAKAYSNKDVCDRLKTTDVKIILDRVKKYSEDNNKRVFINFGGGEPFLRTDIVEIVKYASELFGKDAVGIDTNATLNNSVLLIKQIAPYVSYIGISLNGLKEYHNWWANRSDFDAYSRTLDAIDQLCREPEIVSKLEVTSVATKKNVLKIPELMRLLSEIGVKNYSIHRAIPVGRMKVLCQDLVPSWKEYLILLIQMAETGKEIGMNAHFHHSIESIHASLFCGLDTISNNKVFDKNHRSAIGINYKGKLVVNPWCVGQLWNVLSTNDVLTDKNFEYLMSTINKQIELLGDAFSLSERCNGCKLRCSGGSRIVAAATWLNENMDSQFDNALQATDPACPLAGLEKI